MTKQNERLAIDEELLGMLRCPETGKPYRFDPQTQTIWCETPGHLSEKVQGN